METLVVVKRDIALMADSTEHILGGRALEHIAVCACLWVDRAGAMRTPPVYMEETMDNVSEWTDQLVEAEQQLAQAYSILAKLQADLKAAGRKKDMQAIGEVVERLARYGRLFEDIRQSWIEVAE
jgi:hypothetical protein